MHTHIHTYTHTYNINNMCMVMFTVAPVVVVARASSRPTGSNSTEPDVLHEENTQLSKPPSG